MRRHVIPVGLPGAGKTSVSERLAARLGCVCSDVDRIIEQRLGLDIPSIFNVHGEQFFRDQEREVVDELLTLPAHVISPGGGWIMGMRDSGTAKSHAFLIYLQTDPAGAVARLAGASKRPLLAGGSIGEMESLLAIRRASYQAAECTVVTDGLTIPQVVTKVHDLARDRAGW